MIFFVSIAPYPQRERAVAISFLSPNPYSDVTVRKRSSPPSTRTGALSLYLRLLRH
jgi:hypothetical protein